VGAILARRKGPPQPATVPRTGRKPLGAGAMRAVMRQFEAMGAAISYEIAYCLFRKGEG